MKIKKIQVKNFRLLNDICLSLEDTTTVIVGRNNSGKTSLTELFEHLFSSSSPRFSIEDFSLSIYKDFWESFEMKNQNKEVSSIHQKIPFLEVILTFEYDKKISDLGLLSNFIIDLDPDSMEAIVKIKYEIKPEKIDSFFDNIDKNTTKEKFLKILKERIPRFYSVSSIVIDPTDNTNTKEIELTTLKNTLRTGFINAQRRLDDQTTKEKNVLGRVLEKIVGTAKSETASTKDKETIQNLQKSVETVQSEIEQSFNMELNKLLPTLKMFGYPGLNDSSIQTETILDVERLLENNTKLNYPGADGINLPEAYNGLGTRNLIYILFQLYEFFKSFQASEISPSLQLIFIEEPEAHLHPQMQEVFIRKIKDIAKSFSDESGINWPVQFIITTHSSHIANEADFKQIRYFLVIKEPLLHTKIKDFRDKFSCEELKEDQEFLQKFLTLTRCDLFFCDKVMLIEGPTERILMPRIISNLEKESSITISNQYFSIIEVGGAYAHRFFNLLNFLELKTLVITDLDSSKESTSKPITYTKCEVCESTHTSNVCIKEWFDDKNISPESLLKKDEKEKINGLIRISYQVSEDIKGGLCGRSFEDAFLLSNMEIFNVKGANDKETLEKVKNEVNKISSKTDFALKYAIEIPEWTIPRYIKEGLLWFGDDPKIEIKTQLIESVKQHV